MATTKGPAIPANAMTPAAWDILNSDYATAYQNALKGGQTEEAWAKSPEFLGFQNRTLEGVGNTYDTSKLQSDIASMSAGFDNPIYGDNFRKIVGAEQNRLGYLNGQNSISAPSSAPAYGNPLIAALRANSPAPARQASGIEDLSTGKIFNTPPNTPAFGQWQDPPSRVKDKIVAATQSWINEKGIPSSYVPQISGTPTKQENWDSLNSTYAIDYDKALKSGLSDMEWAASPKFKTYQDEVIKSAGNTWDTNKLETDIASLSQRYGDPVYGENFRKIAAAEQKQLDRIKALGQTVNLELF